MRRGEWIMAAEADPDREEFAHLKYPPFILDATQLTEHWGDLRIDGFINGKKVISSRIPSRCQDERYA